MTLDNKGRELTCEQNKTPESILVGEILKQITTAESLENLRVCAKLLAAAADIVFSNCLEIMQEAFNKIKPVLKELSEKAIDALDNIFLNSEILNDYWIVMDENLFKTIKNSGERTEQDITKIIVDYYTENQFEHLENLFKPYSDIACFVGRLKIINNTILALKSLPQDIGTTVVIPTLLSQITGIYDDLPSLLPKESLELFRRKAKEAQNPVCPLSSDGKKPEACKFVKQANPKIDKDALWAYMQEKMSYSICRTFEMNIQSTFLNGKQIQKEDNITLKRKKVFRHKVLHGDDLEYNTTEKMIRCFLELAFLMKLSVLLSEEKING